MKSIKIYVFFLISLLLISSTYSQQPPSPPTQDEQKQQLPNHNILQLNKPYPEQLKKENNFAAKYRINIPQSAVTELKQSKWFLFVQVETTQQFAWSKTKIQLFTINQNDNQKPLKQCDTTNGLDSCFITNANFDYKKQKIQARVSCQQQCKFSISAQISTKFKLAPNEALELNFQNTAYSKLFQLDTSSFQNFKRLQIILKPKSFLSFNIPIRLYVNKGDTVPTKQKHHYSGIHLWDDGQGVFINFPDASNIFTILVEGPQKNILTLKTNIIYQDKAVKTQSNEPYFSYVQSQEKKLFEIKINKAKKTVVRLTTLTGSIQMSGIKDQDMKNIDQQFTPLLRSYGELQYKFQPEFFQKNKNFKIEDFLIIEIKGNKDSTFVFQSYFTDDSMNILAPEVNRYSDLPSKSSDLYYFTLYQIESNINATKKQARIEIMTTTFQGIDLGTRILTCKAEKISQCSLTKEEIQKVNKNQSIDNDKRKLLKNISTDKSIPGVVYFDTIIPYSEYYKVDSIYRLFVIIVLTNPKQQQILYTLQYIDMGTTYFLKQKQLRRDRLSIDQIKYYTFVNNDKDVKQIKIHSTEISGQILMVGYKQDPRYNVVEGKQIYQYHGTVAFLNVQPGQQIFLEVQGIQNAYYSLYLQLIRTSQNNTDQKGAPGYNQIVIQQNIKYDFFIKPNQKLIVQMHVTNPDFQLFIGSHLPVDLCLTQNLDAPPFKPNCEIMQNLTKNERIGLKMDKGLIGNMGITNNNDKSVQLKLQMKPKNDSVTKLCQDATLGVMNVWSLNASNSSNKNIYCYKFNLNKRESVQIVVEFNNMEYDNQTVTWQINDKQKQFLTSQRHMIMKRQIQKICGNSDLQKCQLTISMESNYSTDVQVVVQYLDKDVLLIDGMAQPSFSKDKNKPKYFRYQMINLISTTIILQNRAGYYHFLGKIVSRKDFYAANPREDIFPTSKDKLFVSENPFYYLYQVYQLSQQTIKKSNCTTQCILLITVQTTNDQSEQEPGRFIIQVSQQDRFLKQNQPSVGYLQRRSLAFYEYYNPSNGTIYVQLNNQNTNCAKIYIKKGNETRATPSAFDKMAENQNFLMYQDAQAGSYSITVQAKGRMGNWDEGCSYTIQVLNSQFKISRIKRGTFNDKKLQANQSAHFMYQHHRQESFKILSLTKLGQIMIKIKVLQEGQLNKILSINSSQLKTYIQKDLTYQDSNIDFLKVHHKKSAYFCEKCTYLISITATKYTQTSIVIPSKDVQIPIIQDATIKDQIKQGQVVKYRVFTSNLAQYKLYVQYGTINVTVTQSVENKTILSKSYSQTKQPIYQKINSTSTSKVDDKGFGYQFLHYDIFTILGVANSSFYSFQLLSTDKEQKGGGNVKYGIPEYFFLQAKQTKCFKGMIDDDSQQFILSFDDSNRQQIKNLTITAKVNDKKSEYKTQYGLNQMTLELQNLKIMEPSPYQICLYSVQFLSLTFIQSAHIMMVPPQTSILITHNTNLTLGAKGTTLIQLDQCSNRSVISISSSFNDLHTTQTQISQVRRGNNLFEFYHWGPVYVHLQTTGARLKWRNKDVYLERGLGYDRFAAGTAHAYKEGDFIKVQAKPIQQVSNYSKDKNFQITEITYKIVLAKNQNQLRNALNCFQQNVLKYQYNTTKIGQSTTASFKIDQSLKQRFSSQKFFFAGVLVNLNVEINKTIQNYRFIYPMVDIQREVLFGNQYIQVDSDKQTKGSDTKSQTNSILLILICAIIVGFAAWIIYRKFIKKWLRKRKQGLADQGSGFKYTQFASMDG